MKNKRLNINTSKLFTAKLLPKLLPKKLLPEKLLVWQTNNLKRRVYLIIFGFIFIYSLIAVRLIYISTSTIFQNDTYSKNYNYRRDIVDRNGNLLASSLPVYSLFANPNKMIEKQSNLERIGQIIKLKDRKALLQKLNSNSKFVWLKYDLTPEEKKKITDLGIAGIGFEKKAKRIYSYSNLLAHVLGYVNVDNIGLAGIERFFDTDLLKNNEKPLELTIDVRIQNIVSAELDNAIKEYSAEGGVAVVINPNSGEILALSSKPDFNPHIPGKATTAQLFNKASLGVYEFGSIFKILTLAIGLDTKTIKPTHKYDVTALKVGKYQIHDFPRDYPGVFTVADLFVKSSNKGIAKIALDIGEENFKNYLKKLQLNSNIITEIPEKTAPIFPNDSNWSPISMVTRSYGYGIATNILTFLQAIIPAVNGGVMYPLTLVKKDIELLEGERVFSEQTSKDVNKLLRRVVVKGTGKRAEVNGYLVGGKSGTAEKLQGNKYSKNSRISSFVSVFPVINPKYLIHVMLDNPKATKKTFGLATGGINAAPTCAKIISRIIALDGMPPYDLNDPSIIKQLSIEKDETI